MILYLIIFLLIVFVIYFIGLYRWHKRKHKHYMRMWEKSQYSNALLLEYINKIEDGVL
jgi:hypothetical protein